MVIDNIIFWVFASLCVLGALGVVFHRSIIYSALLLIVTFLSIAGIFIVLNADFLAIAQTIVYAVGLTIILLFAVMLTGDKDQPRTRFGYPALVAFGVVFALTMGLLLKSVMYPFVETTPSAAYIQILQQQGTTGVLGKLLFQTYALPFEMVSILLLVAMIGAIVLAKKKFYDAEDPRSTLGGVIDQSVASSPEVRHSLTTRVEESSEVVGVQS